MSTRKLILTALVCGLAIMLAGGFKLIQVARDDVEVKVLELGTMSTLGDMTVSVTEIRATADRTLVKVTITGVDGADPREGWRLLANGKVATPVESRPTDGVPCATVSATSTQTCDIAFAPATGSVTVAYLRSGLQSQWAG